MNKYSHGMKKIISVIVLAIIVATAAISASAAGSELSPGIGVIAAGAGMTKSGLKNTDVRFAKEDFTAALGLEPSTVTFTSLPPASDGTLYLSSVPVAVNQTVSGRNLSLLKFIPTNGTDKSSFRFTTDRTYSVECTVRLTDVANRAPAANMKESAAPASLVRTQRDVTCTGKLSGADPDGDRLTFEITKYPEHGIIILTDKEAGTFRYTPYEGNTGTDSVSYRVFDEYGNYSDEAKITIKTDKRVVDAELCDMNEHWGYNAALYALGDKSMAAIRRNGELYFMPDEAMTREAFLATVMKSLGAPALSEKRTVFADDGEISGKYSGYVDAAEKLGIVQGTETDGKLCFRPKEVITRAEAAVILNRIVGAKTVDAAANNSDGAIPAWAAQDVSALSEKGIMSGDDLSSPVTRAQAAQMLYNVKNVYLY